jgi:Mg/Co/Ni transporter MgtE
MKHVEVSLVVGAILGIVALITTIAWALANILVGPVAATIIVTLVIVGMVAAGTIDYLTERRQR